jgi:cytochrome c-type biogenesis protein CcmF
MLSILINTALIATLIFSTVQFFVAKKFYIKLEYVKTIAACCAALVVIYACVADNFSLSISFNSSSVIMPLHYKIASIWSTHEGSMLLWLCVMCVGSLILSFNITNDKQQFIYGVLWWHNVLICLFATYVVFFASPATKMLTIFNDGLGMNPSLQNAFILTHPPKLFFGYVGCAILWAIGMEMLLGKDTYKYVDFVRKCTFIVWFFLTIGIMLGAAWAYRQLGWGGFWSWDPVENISLAPWLAITIAVHLIALTKKNVASSSYFAMTVIAAFNFVVCGTFLVRFAPLDSVHSFNISNNSGLFLLLIVVFVCTISCGAVIKCRNNFLLIFTKKSTPIVACMLLVALLLICLSLGTILPCITSIQVDENYYNFIFGVVLLPILAGMIATSGVGGKIILCILPFGLLPVLFYYNGSVGILSYLLLMLSGVLFLCYIYQLCIARYGVARSIAHSGFALIVLSVVVCGNFATNRNLDMAVGETVSFESFSITLSDISYTKESNFLSRMAYFTVARNGKKVATLTPQVKFFPVENTFTSNTDSVTYNFNDIYIAVAGLLHNKQGAKLQVALYYKPLIGLFWLGGFLIVSAILLLICIKKFANK